MSAKTHEKPDVGKTEDFYRRVPRSPELLPRSEMPEDLVELE